MPPVPASLDPNAGGLSDGDINAMISLPNILSKGTAAIQSGAMSPQEAQQHLADAGNIMSMAKPSTASPYIFQDQSQPPGGQIPIGAKAQKSTTDKSEKTDKSTRNVNMTGDEFNTEADKIRNTPEFQQMAQGDQALQNQIDQVKAMRGKSSSAFWLKPLMDLTDAQTGSNFAKNYQPGGDLSAQLLKYQDEMAKRKQDQLKLLTGSMKDLKTGTDVQGLQSQINNMNMSGYGGAGAGAQTGNILKWSQQLNGDKSIAGANQAMDASTQLDALLQTNSSPADFMAKVMALRASGLPRISQQEIMALSGDKGISERMSQALETLINGKFTGTNVDEFKKAAQDLSATAPSVLTHARKYYETLGRSVGVPETSLQDMLAQKLYRGQPQAPPAAAPAAPPPAAAAPPAKGAAAPDLNADLSKMSKDELKTWLATHGG